MRAQPESGKGQRLIRGCLCLFAAVASGAACAAESFEERSAAIRTALHYDAALPGQVEELCRLYAAASRRDELERIYEAHVASYPGDKAAGCVLLRIYQNHASGRAESWAKTLAARFPDDADVLDLAFASLGEVALLAESIRLEADAGRRLERMERLLEVAEGAEDRARAGELLIQVGTGQAADQAGWQGLANAALAQGFAAEVASWLRTWAGAPPEGEAGVEREQLLARAEEALGEKAAAEQRLRGVLAKLEAGTARREGSLEALFRLLSGQGRTEEELGRLRDDHGQHPQDATRALDLAYWLCRMDRQEEAAQFLRQASLRLPDEALLEGQALEVLAEGERVAYLREKLTLEGQAERADLRARLARLLFVRGEIEAAREEWGRVESSLAPRERQEQRLRLARELAAGGKEQEAARLLESVIREEPGRIKERWELAALLENQGDAPGVRAALSGAGGDGLDRETALAHADKLLACGLWEEAERWLEAAQGRWGGAPELMVRQLGVLAAKGSWSEGRRLIDQMRTAAGTAEAYRGWLEAALGFQAEGGAGRRFFEAERKRLLAGDWTVEKARRFLALCDVARESGARDEVIGWLRCQLDAAEGPLGEELRRMLVAVLGDDEAHALEVEAQLKWLLDRPPFAREEDRLRLAVLYARGSRPDLARPLLRAATVEKVTEVAVLEAGARSARTLGEYAVAGALLRRWTVLAPAKAAAWEARLGFLREQEMEEDCRLALEECETVRQEDQGRLSQQQLRAWWAESALRSLLEWHWEGREGEAAALLAKCRRRAGESSGGWARWMETLRSGNLAWRGGGAVGEWISFPGEWRLKAVEAGTALRWAAEIREPGLEQSWPVPDRPRLKWVYDAGRAVVAAEADWAAEAALLLDAQSAVHAVDLATGKLRWKRTAEEWRGAGGGDGEYLSREGGAPLLLRSGDRLLKVNCAGELLAKPCGRCSGAGNWGHRLAMAGDVAVVVAGRELAGLEARDGRVRWRVSIALPAARRRRLPWDAGSAIRVLGTCAGGVAAFDSAAGVLALVDGASGKLRWIAGVEAEFAQAGCDEGAVVLLAGQGARWQVRNGANGKVVWEGPGSVAEGAALRLAGRLACLGDGSAWELRPVRLPLVGRRVEARGAVAGGAGRAMVCWGAGGLCIVDGGRGETRPISRGGGDLLAAFAGGGRLVTVDEGGYAVWSLPWGRRLRERPWPDEGAEWLRPEGSLEWRAGRVFRRVWTESGPVEREIPAAWGAAGQGCWWMTWGDRRVVCWEEARE